MKTGLNRKTLVDGPGVAIMLDVWEIKDKEIIFSGTTKEVAKYLGTTDATIRNVVKRKSKYCKKRYAIRHHSEKS
jgi:hypothetical protein